MRKRITAFHILIAVLSPVIYPTIIETQAQTAGSLQEPGPVNAADGMAFANTMQNDLSPRKVLQLGRASADEIQPRETNNVAPRQFGEELLAAP